MGSQEKKYINFEDIKHKVLLKEEDHYFLYKASYEEQSILLKQFKTEHLSLEKVQFYENEFNQKLKGITYYNLERIIGTYINEEKRLFTLSHFFEGKSLAQFIKEDIKHNTFELKCKILYEIGLSLFYLHSKNQFLCNLNSNSINLDYNNDFFVKVMDFGLNEIKDTIDVHEEIIRTNQTLYWKAPELDLNFNSGSIKGDIYSYGIILWEVLSEKTIIDDIEYIKLLNNNNRYIPLSIYKLIKLCLNEDATLRPKLETILETLHHYVGTEHLDSLSMSISFPNGANNELEQEEKGLIIKLEHQEQEILYRQGIEFKKQQQYIKAANCFDLPAWNNHLLSQFELAKIYLSGYGREMNIKTGLYWADKASNQFHLDSEYLIANLNYFGINNSYKVDFNDATFRYLKLSKKGYIDSYVKLGYCYEKGKGADKDYFLAVKNYELAVENKNPIAMFRLGKMYELGLGVEKDINKSIELYKMGTELDSSPCQFYLGNMHELGLGVNKDILLAMNYYSLAANKTHPKAIYSLAKLYLKGHNNILPNYNKAMKLFLLAAELNIIRAYHSIGHMYDMGHGVKKDNKEAFKYYYKAAILGDRLSQNNLARCYHLGIGVDKNMDEAVKWYKSSAMQQVPQALVNLGICYEYGEGVSKDLKEAFNCYNKASELNDPNALFKLGYCYEQGIGVNKDLNRCLRCYQKAKEKGLEKAKIRFDEVLKKVQAK